ncbi:MAG TPA: hypothetical protein QF604_09185 [Candidatus Latescibacteria bacterium]|jgi:hypothetical protein|nr:hypothetical protein [Candidatus Latescibacterota bacterium]HJN28078.1 hypothetical protein [Candidatus Latescibacterota bacterium]|tara:strand:- start:228 stop:1058 length:831 start_codon:yes stop_codon:yes gene_type:complete
MMRKLTLVLTLLAVLTAPVLADHHMEGEPPMHPEIVLGPPEGFEPPEGEEPPPMEMPPEEMESMMVEKFFQFMDANGDGAVDFDEFMPWVRASHMPPPPMDGEGMHGAEALRKLTDMEPPPDGMGPPPDGMGPGPEGVEGGLLIEGEGDLADLPLAPECSDELRNNEQDPQAENVPCGDREGNLIFRTICNMPGFESQAISLPDGRGAGCFGLEALRGEIAFEIVAEDGTVLFNTNMGKEAYMGLHLEGPGVFEVRSVDGSPDGGVTIRFTDVALD